VADSGDDEGEASIIRGESNVEFVVVGDDAVDSVLSETTLWRRWRGGGGECVVCGPAFASCRGTASRSCVCVVVVVIVVVVVVVVGVMVVVVIVAAVVSGGCALRASWMIHISALPTTDMKDGKEGGMTEASPTRMLENLVNDTERRFVEGATTEGWGPATDTIRGPSP